MTDLEISDAEIAGAPGVSLSGELDFGSAPRVVQAIDAAIDRSVGAFVIDLCDLSFLDSSGINVLLRARSLLGRDDRTLVVVCPTGPVRRVFEVAGIEDLLALYESRDEAAASLVPVD
jgi:anti-sigma B factor antagonist